MLVWIADTGMEQAGLERLAAKLGRPARSLAAFERLTQQELAALSQLIDEACRREREALRAGSPQLLPAPLRRLFLRLLGWREP